MPEKIQTLIVHHSASMFGHALEIDRWHRSPPRNWKMIGYHWVILNGYPIGGLTKPFDFLVGQIEVGRAIDQDTVLEPDEIGAHAYGQNKNTLGVCLVGNGQFFDKQFFALKYVEQWLRGKKMINEVKGHYEVEKLGYTECPGIDMDKLRFFLSSDWSTASRYLYSIEMQQYIRKI